MPVVGHTVEENEKAGYEILERLKKEKVDEATLDRVKTKLRAALIRNWIPTPASPQQLASLLRQLRRLAQAVHRPGRISTR